MADDHVHIGRWSTDLRRSLADVPRTVRDEARQGARELMGAGIRHAPRHTGALQRSLRVMARATADGVDLALYSDDPAAGIQQTGGILRAGRSLMTVPIGEERIMWDRTGTRREAHQVPGLFRIIARDGREYLATREGRRLVLRFALRHTVRMPAQKWATKAIKAAAAKIGPKIRVAVRNHLLANKRVR